MSSEAHQKVTASHLRRNAYLYVRQSKIRRGRRESPRATHPCPTSRTGAASRSIPSGLRTETGELAWGRA